MNNREVRFHRIRDFKQYYFNRTPPNSQCCGSQRLPSPTTVTIDAHVETCLPRSAVLSSFELIALALRQFNAISIVVGNDLFSTVSLHTLVLMHACTQAARPVTRPDSSCFVLPDRRTATDETASPPRPRLTIWLLELIRVLLPHLRRRAGYLRITRRPACACLLTVPASLTTIASLARTRPRHLITSHRLADSEDV